MKNTVCVNCIYVFASYLSTCKVVDRESVCLCEQGAKRGRERDRAIDEVEQPKKVNERHTKKLKTHLFSKRTISLLSRVASKAKKSFTLVVQRCFSFIDDTYTQYSVYISINITGLGKKSQKETHT